MARLLIYSVPDDYHVSAVAWGLTEFGVACDLWMASDLPDFAALTVKLDGLGTHVVLRQSGRADPVRLDDVDLIWNRRFAYPAAPAFASEADRPFIENQCYEHMNGIRQLLGRRIRTINGPAAQSLAARKTVQLDQAGRSGFAIPKTLISNDFEEIRRFCREQGPTVVKPFKTVGWKDGGKVYTYYTSAMVEPTEDLRAELELCPQIFQERIAREREVRLVAFGGRTYAMNITTEQEGGADDARMAMRVAGADYSVAEIPATVAGKVRAYMAALGLDYGAFDFAVTPEGEWYFLECNEGGQFLFLETALPEMKILDGFCRWLCELMGHRPSAGLPPLTIRGFEDAGGCRGLPPSPGLHKRGVLRGALLDESVDSRAGSAKSSVPRLRSQPLPPKPATARR